MSHYISAVDTAKLVRKELKERFPTVKFSVRTSQYAGGSSIDVSWDDGPTTKQVEHVIGKYHGYVDKVRAEDIFMGLQPLSERPTIVRDWTKLRDWEIKGLMNKGYPEAVAEYKRRKSDIVAQAEEIMQERSEELKAPSPKKSKRHEELRTKGKAARKQRGRYSPFSPSVSKMR